MEKKLSRDLIVDNLKQKSSIKQKVYDNTLETFNLIKETLQDIVKDVNKDLKKEDKRVLLEYTDRGPFEAELKVSGDLLIFNMHSNIFDFYREHNIWKLSYVQENAMSTYSGIINVYNFLTDSFKYDRVDDLGYLIARIFINKDKQYFVEGKRQFGFLYNNFGTVSIQKETVRKIIESAILYAMEFDLLVPTYDTVKIVSVAQIKERLNRSYIKTGKRLGFKFYADDEEIAE